MATAIELHAACRRVTLSAPLCSGRLSVAVCESGQGIGSSSQLTVFLSKRKQRAGEPIPASMSTEAPAEPVTASTTVSETMEQPAGGESALVKAMKAMNSRSAPVLPNTCLCSLNGQTTTCAAVDRSLNNIAIGIPDHNAIDLLSFKDFKKGRGGDYDDKKTRLRGHTDSICDISFIPDSSLILSSSTDCTIRIWESVKETDSHQKAVYTGHLYPVWSISVSPFALYFASASADTTAKLWTTDRTFPIRVFASHTSEVNCVRFHPNCNYIATASSDRSVRLWSVNDAKCIRMFPGHRTAVYSLSFSPDGQFLASAGDDNCIKVWDLRSSNVAKELRGHTDTIKSLEWNSDASLLVSASLDASLRIWDMTSLSAAGPKSGGEKKWTGSGSQVVSTPLAAIETKHRMIRTQFSSHNVLFAFGLK